MENEEKIESYKLDFPANVKTRFELYNGIGIKEIIVTVVAGIVSVILALFINSIINNTFICILMVFVITAGTLLGNMKDKGNQCIFGTIKNMFKFMKNQKYFKYQRKERCYALVQKDIRK